MAFGTGPTQQPRYLLPWSRFFVVARNSATSGCQNHCDLDDVAVRVAQENIELSPGMENIRRQAFAQGVEIEAGVCP